MKEHPILFKPQMVRAIRAGLKTQTRGVLDPQPFPDGYHHGDVTLDRVWDGTARFSATAVGGGAIAEHIIPIRYRVGDRLWVREGWWVSRRWDGTAPRDIPPKTCTVFFEGGGSIANQDHPGDWRPIDTPEYGAELPEWVGKKRPGMFLPRWAARLILTVTDVRVERLQDISDADALAEGVYRQDPTAEDLAEGCTPDDFVFIAPGVPQGFGMTRAERQRDTWWPNASGAFGLLWRSINGHASWDANPWVAAYTFEEATGERK
jgi:hypothetical protein